MEKIYYTPQDVQEMLGLRRQTVYMMLESGKIPALKLSKTWRIPIKDFHEWLDNETYTQTQRRGKHG